MTHDLNINIINKDILYYNKEYTKIISVIGTYCNELALFWFHRLLYAQTFLSFKIPKYIFILIHNINGKECIKYNKDKELYNVFISFIMTDLVTTSKYLLNLKMKYLVHH